MAARRARSVDDEPIVDLGVDLCHADPRDLCTLRRLGTVAVVGTWGGEGRGEGPADPEARLWAAIERGLPRLAESGLGGGLCLGLSPERIPAVGLARLLARLPDTLGQPGILGIGPVGPGGGGRTEVRVLDAQLELAAHLKRPVLAVLPHRAQAAALPLLVSSVRRAGLSPERVMVLGGRATSIETLHALGFACVLDALGILEGARLASRLGPSRLALGTGLGSGPADLLGPRRLLREARGVGLSPAAVRALARGSAARHFSLSLAG